EFGAPHDAGCVGPVSVELVVGAAIGAQSRAVKRDSGKDATSAGVAENFRAHESVGVGVRSAALGTRSGGSVCAKSDLGAHEAVGAAIIHDQEDEVCGFAADLKAEAATFQRIHGRSSPRPGEVLAGAADHGPTAIAGADKEGGLQDGRYDHDATRLIEQIAW